jgi:hypothetical protein
VQLIIALNVRFVSRSATTRKCRIKCGMHSLNGNNGGQTTAGYIPDCVTVMRPDEGKNTSPHDCDASPSLSLITQFFRGRCVAGVSS